MDGMEQLGTLSQGYLAGASAALSSPLLYDAQAGPFASFCASVAGVTAGLSRDAVARGLALGLSAPLLPSPRPQGDSALAASGAAAKVPTGLEVMTPLAWLGVAIGAALLLSGCGAWALFSRGAGRQQHKPPLTSATPQSTVVQQPLHAAQQPIAHAEVAEGVASAPHIVNGLQPGGAYPASYVSGVGIAARTGQYKPLHPSISGQGGSGGRRLHGLASRASQAPACSSMRLLEPSPALGHEEYTHASSDALAASLQNFELPEQEAEWHQASSPAALAATPPHLRESRRRSRSRSGERRAPARDSPSGGGARISRAAATAVFQEQLHHVVSPLFAAGNPELSGRAGQSSLRGSSLSRKSGTVQFE